MKLRFDRKKPRHAFLSVCYRLARLPLAGANRKMRFWLDLNWITWRLAIEQAHVMYGFGDHSMRRKNLDFLLARLKAGDRVLISKWAGTEITIDGQELLVVKESDIMGIIEGGAAAKKAA